MTKKLEPQVSAEDLELIRETRRDLHANRAVPITIRTRIVSGVNKFTDEPIYSTSEVTISGVVQALTDEDRLLKLGGKIRIGDLKLTLLYEEAVDLVGLADLRGATVVHPVGDGAREYLVDVFDQRGIGLPNRIELGLVLK